MSAPETTLHEAMIDLVQALMKPRPLQDRPPADHVAIVQDSRMLMASLVLDGAGIRPLALEDIKDLLARLVDVVDRTPVRITPAMMASLTGLVSAIAESLKGGAP